MRHFAEATWKGNGLQGNGYINVQSKYMSQAPYTFNSRFNDTNGTNPEELLAAAHASDFTMKLSFILTEAGYIPDELITTCFINFDRGRIVSSTLELKADVPGIDKDTFNNYVEEANAFCPISEVLNIAIIIQATLEGNKRK